MSIKYIVASLLWVKCIIPSVTRPVLDTVSNHHVHLEHPDPGQNIIQIILKIKGTFVSFLQAYLLLQSHLTAMGALWRCP